MRVDFIFSKDTDEEYLMASKNYNIKNMINDKAY